ncbi:hypothetical protein VKS41_001601 [Umbelopsis sp. WA50703]
MANQDQLQGLLAYLLNDSQIERYLPFVLESLSLARYIEDDSAESTNFHKWITRLNSLLHSKNSTARYAGITLIRATCEQSNMLYLANVSSWVPNILNLLTRPEPTAVQEEAIKTLLMLFAKAADKPEVQREVTTPNLPKFNHALLNLSGNKDLLPVIFDALISSFTNFPTTSRPIADNSRKLCLSLLDGSLGHSTSIIESASACLTTIFLTATNANRPELWRTTALRLLGTANRALDRLFDAIDEESSNSDKLPAYDFPPVVSEYSEAFIVLFKRTEAINEALIKTLTTSSHSAMNVPVAQIVDYLCRIYNVNAGSLMRDFKDKAEYNCLMAGMPKLILNTNRLFAAMIHCCGNSLIRYLRLFSSLLLQLLTQNKKKRVVRASIYQLVTLCLQKFGVGFGEMVSKPLLAIIFEDIQLPKRRQNTATDSKANVSVVGKQPGKKRKRDITNSDEIVQSQAEDSPTTLLLSSLEVLTALLMCYGSSLSAEQRSSIDSLLLSRILKETQEINGEKSIECVTEMLYECLIASVVRPIETQASVLPHALHIFSAGTHCQSHRLRLVCTRGLSICEIIMHSRLPPIPRSESKAAPVVYIPGLGNLLDENAIDGSKSAAIKSSDMVNDMEQDNEPEIPIMSFRDEMSDLSQRTLKPNSSFEYKKPDNSLTAKIHSPVKIASVNETKDAPHNTQSNGTATLHAPEPETQTEVKRIRIEETKVVEHPSVSEDKFTVQTEVTESNAVIVEQVITPASLPAKKEVTKVPSAAVMSDDEDMMDIPEIDMGGPDSDVESD